MGCITDKSNNLVTNDLFKSFTAPVEKGLCSAYTALDHKPAIRLSMMYLLNTNKVCLLNVLKKIVQFFGVTGQSTDECNDVHDCHMIKYCGPHSPKSCSIVFKNVNVGDKLHSPHRAG